MTSSTATELEIEILEDLILRGWRYFTLFQTSLARDSQELDVFLNEYQQLEGWLLSTADSGKAAGTGEGGEAPSASHANLLHARQKKLFRDIVKLCHPDVAAYASSHYLHRAMDAYAAGDGAALMRLQMELWQSHYSPAAYLQQLKQLYRELQKQVNHAREASQYLRQSPGWQLYCSSQRAKAVNF